MEWQLLRAFLSLLVLNIFTSSAFSEITIISWNAKHLGRKSQDLKASASLLTGGDLIAIQEVNAGVSGAKALFDLSVLLAREGVKYCVGLSEIPTDSRERYGILWRDAAISYVSTNGSIIDRCPPQAITLRLGAAGADKIVREPAVGIFLERSTQKKFHFATIHLVPTAKHPEKEIEPLFSTIEGLPGKYPRIVAGDFNLSSDHSAFVVARELGYVPALRGEERTSLKAKTRGMSKAFDNVWTKNAKSLDAQVISSIERFRDRSQEEIYRNISDHAPIMAVIKFD